MLVGTVATTTERTATASRVTTSGTIAAGAQSVTVTNVGSASGTLLGVTLEAGSSKTISVGGNDTLAAIAYNATGTTFDITEIR